MDGKNDLLTRLQSLMAAFDEEAWVALANRGLLRRARKDLETGTAPRLLDAPPDLIRVAVDPYVVEMDARGPAAARCTCPAPGCCQHILAACLHLAATGNPEGIEEVKENKPAIEDSPPPKPSKSPKAVEPKKTDGLQALQTLLEQTVTLGFSHPDSSWVQRMRGLSLQCRVEGWPRAALEANAWATELERLLERKATSDVGRLFAASAGLYALAESLMCQGNDAPPELVGSFRTVYDSQGALGLLGLGAYPWETDSGHLGVTALFWCPEREQVFSWSDSRPRAQRGRFTPVNAYAQAVPWGGGHGLKSLLGQRFELVGATANLDRRLGSSQNCRISKPPAPPIRADLPPALTQWAELRNRPRANGLRRGSPLDGVVRLRPEQWGEPVFDEFTQSLLLPLRDTDGDTLHLVLPHTPWTKAGVEQIERATFLRGVDSLIGFPASDESGFFPVGWLRCGKRIEFRSLYFPDNHSPQPGTRTPPPAWRSTLIHLETPENTTDLSDPLDVMMAQIGEALERAVLEGTAPVLDPVILQTLEKAGAQRFAKALHQPHTPRHLLVLRYLLDSRN
ncbi:MAG: SWIM zinc finger family protein [Verrucomicrobia bacterium]|nr:SWIM zinc finger family protein [Verrucomicrobiota bacterium]